MLFVQRNEQEIVDINQLIEKYLSNKQNLVGIEIGSYAGESAQLLLNSGAFKTLYCIDPWLPGWDPTDASAGEDIVIAEQVFDNKFKNNKVIKKVKMTAEAAASNFEDESIDFLYIDGNHQYAAVKRNLIDYFSKVKKGGMISGHDYAWDTVRRAVTEYFQNFPRDVYGSNWIYIKD